MSLVTMIPLDKDGNPIKKKKKNPTSSRFEQEMDTWKDYHPPRLRISDPLGGDHLDPAPMDLGQISSSDLKIRRETDPAPVTLPVRDLPDQPRYARYGSTQGDVSNRFGVPDAPQVTTPPNSMFMRSQNAAGVRMKRSKAARSGRSSKGTKQFNRMMSINSLNV
tara:strand:+ start:864 stop:1355 length:492 start_codon:yes stop_codon:yes gene_type:complete